MAALPVSGRLSLESAVHGEQVVRIIKGASSHLDQLTNLPGRALYEQLGWQRDEEFLTCHLELAY
jgi:hypothetical protein